MGARNIWSDEDIGEVMKEAARESHVQDSYTVKDGHKKIHETMRRAKDRGTFEFNQDGKLVRVEGKPAKSKKQK